MVGSYALAPESVKRYSARAMNLSAHRPRVTPRAARTLIAIAT